MTITLRRQYVEVLSNMSGWSGGRDTFIVYDLAIYSLYGKGCCPEHCFCALAAPEFRTVETYMLHPDNGGKLG